MKTLAYILVVLTCASCANRKAAPRPNTAEEMTQLYWGDIRFDSAQEELPATASPQPDAQPSDLDFRILSFGVPSQQPDAWANYLDAVESQYIPFKFTTLPAWEWPTNSNSFKMQRTIVLREGKEIGSKINPADSLQADQPEKLWAWLDETGKKVGAGFLAIDRPRPLGKGQLFPMKDSQGQTPSFEQAKLRLKWEPVLAISLANREQSRLGLLIGVILQQKVGFNPFQWGLLGASTPSAVWAEANTRDAIFSAIQRKEVYTTTGPRIRIRFFTGWKVKEKFAKSKNIAKYGYRYGTPMGSAIKLAPIGKRPRFLMYAMKDPNGANLDRIQIVKAWIGKKGEMYEETFDVVWSGKRKRDKEGELQAVGNTVDVATGKYTNTIGAEWLTARWVDNDFSPNVPAVYIMRVLQIPTPSDTLTDAVLRGADASAVTEPTRVDYAYSSPIWYSP